MTLRQAAILPALMLLVGCNARINTESPVPKCSVSYTLNIMTDAPILDTQGGYYTVTEPTKYGQYIGFGGLLIVHGFDDRFYAYDLCCPVECVRTTRITPSMAGTATCAECGTEYDIGFGSGMPTHGGDALPLRRYTVSLSGYDLRVTN